MAWANADDVQNAWIGDDAPSDDDLLAVWIRRAERLIRHDIPGIQARVDAEEPDLLENIIDVVTAMVTRKFRNPEGYRQVNTTTGPFTQSGTLGGDNPGELELLPKELALLTAGDDDAGQAFSIDLIPSTSPFSPNYVPVWPWA